MKFKCDVCGEVDYGVLDGYAVGDRLLEGVLFDIHINGQKPTAAVQHRFASYFDDLNKEKWLKAMEEHAEEQDIFQCPECGGDMGNPLLPPPTNPPKQFKMISGDEFTS